MTIQRNISNMYHMYLLLISERSLTNLQPVKVGVPIVMRHSI